MAALRSVVGAQTGGSSGGAMILVDTSIWVTHLNKGNPRLRELLEDGRVACHSFIIGELACGRFPHRAEVLRLLKSLPHAEIAAHEEVLELVERRSLMGTGVGYIDAHLLASALISHLPLWTADGKLAEVSYDLGVAYPG
jgi:predicted nucleic acid-binding protein